MLFYITIFIIIGILIYCLFLVFGLSFLKAGKRMDETDYKLHKNYLEEVKRTGELPIEEIKKLEEENNKLIE